MIIGTPETVAGEQSEAYHGGSGPFFRRTLLEDVPGSAIKYCRDITVPPGTVIGDHLHVGDEELYFIVSGTGIMVVDGEERVVGPGSAILTPSGSSHGIRNESIRDLRLFVVCTQEAGHLA